MEEKMRILNLLKEGKITTDEAARLLDAVDKKIEETEPPKHHFKFKKYHIPGLETMSENVVKAVENAVSKVEATFGTHSETCERKFPAKSNMKIRSVSGDIDIEGGDYAEILLDCCGLNKTNEHEDEFVFSSISNDIDVKIPEKTNLSVSAVSGDVEIDNITGDIECESASGDMKMTAVKGKVTVRTASGDVEMNEIKGGVEIKNASGDIEINYLEPNDSAIQTRSGDIEITFPKKTDVILELYSKYGDINVSGIKDYEELDKGEGYIKIGIGKQSKLITTKTKSGNIEVKSE